MLLPAVILFSNFGRGVALIAVLVAAIKHHGDLFGERIYLCLQLRGAGVDHGREA